MSVLAVFQAECILPDVRIITTEPGVCPPCPPDGEELACVRFQVEYQGIKSFVEFRILWQDDRIYVTPAERKLSLESSDESSELDGLPRPDECPKSDENPE